MSEVLKELVNRSFTLQEFIDANYEIELFTTGANEQIVIRDLFVAQEGVPDGEIRINGIPVSKLANASGSEIVDVNSTVTIALNESLKPALRVFELHTGTYVSLSGNDMGDGTSYSVTSTIHVNGNYTLRNRVITDEMLKTASDNVVATPPASSLPVGASVAVGHHTDNLGWILDGTSTIRALLDKIPAGVDYTSSIGKVVQNTYGYDNTKVAGYPVIANGKYYQIFKDTGLNVITLPTSVSDWSGVSGYEIPLTTDLAADTTSGGNDRSGLGVAGKFIFGIVPEAIRANALPLMFVLDPVTDNIAYFNLNDYHPLATFAAERLYDPRYVFYQASQNMNMRVRYSPLDDTYVISFSNKTYNDKGTGNYKLIITDALDIKLIDMFIGGTETSNIVTSDDGLYYTKPFLAKSIGEQSVLSPVDTSISQTHTSRAISSESVTDVNLYKFKLNVRLTGVQLTS